MEERSPRILRSNSCRASFEDAVTWWTYLVRVMCVEVTNDSALPVVVIPAWAIASVYPLPNSHNPIALRTANSMRRPPIISTSLSSPMVSWYLYGISLAKPYMGWSNSITAVCPWLRCSTAFIATVMPCLIMAIEWAASARRGSNDLWHRAGCRVSVVLRGKQTMILHFQLAWQQWVAYPLCLNFWHDQGGIYVGIAGWQWACSLWCRHISLLKACVFHTFPFHS